MGKLTMAPGVGNVLLMLGADSFVEPEPMSGCWLWTGSVNQAGYAQRQYKGRVCLYHRVVYEVAYGPIPIGYVIDHKCGTRSCVNPAHLQAVTRGRNIWLGFHRDGRRTKPRKEFCKRGLHKMEGSNVIDCNGRTCRACKREHARAV